MAYSQKSAGNVLRIFRAAMLKIKAKIRLLFSTQQLRASDLKTIEYQKKIYLPNSFLIVEEEKE